MLRAYGLRDCFPAMRLSNIDLEPIKQASRSLGGRYRQDAERQKNPVGRNGAFDSIAKLERPAQRMKRWYRIRNAEATGVTSREQYATVWRGL